MKHKQNIIASAVLVALILFAVCVLPGGHNINAEALVNEREPAHVVNVDKHTTGIAFARSIDVPRQGNVAGAIYEMSWMDATSGGGTITLRDQESDEAHRMQFTFRPAAGTVTATYSVTVNGEPGAGIHSDYEYGRGQGIAAPVTEYDGGVTKALRQQARVMTKRLSWLVQNGYDRDSLRTVDIYLHQNKQTVQKYIRNQQRRVLGKRSNLHTARAQALLNTILVPVYSDQQWRAAIARRAQARGLSVAKVEVVAAAGKLDQYDYYKTDLLAAVDAGFTGYIRGGSHTDNGKYYQVVTKTGKRYLVLLPYALYTRAALKAYNVDARKSRGGFDYFPDDLATFTCAVRPADFVQKGTHPSAALIAANITLAAAATDMQ